MKDIPSSPLRNPAEIRQYLLSRQDIEYRNFCCKLMPTVPAENVIGIRMPMLRKLCRNLRGTEAGTLFLAETPHRYYEENNLHGLLLSCETDFARCLDGLHKFLPYVDNWATCDLIAPRCFADKPAELLPEIRQWMHSSHTYTVRFGIGMLMRHFLDADFQPEYLYEAASLPTDEYYIHMMVAWYFATALAKQYEATLPILQQCRTDRRTHNKIIQKAIESYRISATQKQYLRTLRR